MRLASFTPYALPVGHLAQSEADILPILPHQVPPKISSACGPVMFRWCFAVDSKYHTLIVSPPQ